MYSVCARVRGYAEACTNFHVEMSCHNCSKKVVGLNVYELSWKTSSAPCCGYFDAFGAPLLSRPPLSLCDTSLPPSFHPFSLSLCRSVRLSFNVGPQNLRFTLNLPAYPLRDTPETQLYSEFTQLPLGHLNAQTRLQEPRCTCATASALTDLHLQSAPSHDHTILAARIALANCILLTSKPLSGLLMIGAENDASWGGKLLLKVRERGEKL